MKIYFNYKIYLVFLLIQIIQISNRLFVKEDFSGRPIAESLASLIFVPLFFTILFSWYFSKQPKEVGKNGYTLLMDLCKQGNLESVKNTISMFQQAINLQDEKGYSALMYGVSSGNSDLVKFLLENGADKNLTTKEGNNAVFFAKKSNLTEIIKILE